MESRGAVGDETILNPCLSFYFPIAFFLRALYVICPLISHFCDWFLNSILLIQFHITPYNTILASCSILAIGQLPSVTFGLQYISNYNYLHIFLYLCCLKKSYPFPHP